MPLCRILVATSLLLLIPIATHAGTVSATYLPLIEGDTIDLTTAGPLDWIKFGNGHNGTSFLNTTKIGNPVFLPATLAPIGTPPDDEHTVELIAVTGFSILNFTWSNGNFGMYNDPGPVDTVVTEAILPEVDEYPIGLGATFDALASANTRIMDVYVQGFNADMVLTASMDGGGSVTPITVSPNFRPSTDDDNDYAVGIFRITYSGAGETLTVSVIANDNRTDGAQSDFANAGFFGASVVEVPEPTGFTLAALALAGMVVRRRKTTKH